MGILMGILMVFLWACYGHCSGSALGIALMRCGLGSAGGWPVLVDSLCKGDQLPARGVGVHCEGRVYFAAGRLIPPLEKYDL